MARNNKHIKKDIPSRSQRVTKKNQILSLYSNGMTDVNDLAHITETRPSYAASVLQQAGLVSGYFDLYTSTSSPMNAYSHLFTNKLRFKDEELSKQSVNFLDRLYKQFEKIGDRAGQHHTLIMALTMFNRARWTNKMDEADIFRDWLIRCLEDAQTSEESSPD